MYFLDAVLAQKKRHPKSNGVYIENSPNMQFRGGTHSNPLTVLVMLFSLAELNSVTFV